ncbi:hypothetical protein HLB42_20420 (plasmid) [Deinococcus sp. D7000]|nr:hypothetical protein HLB42_20420 [Deinococcus sp. D7000]
MTDTTQTAVLTFDCTETNTDHCAAVPAPTHAAQRGGHRLPFMCQQLGRDLAGEQYAREPHSLDVMRLDDQARERRNTPYRFIVTQPPASSHTAFRTAEELYAWCSAYAVTLTPTPRRRSSDFRATTGDPADWQPLEIHAL